MQLAPKIALLETESGLILLLGLLSFMHEMKPEIAQFAILSLLMDCRHALVKTFDLPYFRNRSFRINAHPEMVSGQNRLTNLDFVE
jgi:hypothetical protein